MRVATAPTSLAEGAVPSSGHVADRTGIHSGCSRLGSAKAKGADGWQCPGLLRAHDGQLQLQRHVGELVAMELH